MLQNCYGSVTVLPDGEIWQKKGGTMENNDFVGYALGFVPGAFTEDRIKKWKKSVSLARKQQEAKIKKAKAKRKNKQKGKRR